MSITKRLAEWWQGMPARSPKWAGVRKQFLKWNPTCAACGSKENLEVHHVKPFHLFPELELAPENLVVLCENGGNCHLTFGHLKNWKSYNLAVRQHAILYLDLVKKRP
jgi:5-methylcytosine-specific restriction protein A